jgi:hypothetical protein
MGKTDVGRYRGRNVAEGGPARRFLQIFLSRLLCIKFFNGGMGQTVTAV